MTNSNTPETKNTRREKAREQAKIMRTQQKKRESRRKIILFGSISAAVLAVILIVILIIVSGAKTNTSTANPKNMLSDGVLMSGSVSTVVSTEAIPVGENPVPTAQDETKVNVTVYLDYLCPFCAAFEQENAALLESSVADGEINLEYHPVAVLSEYSLRAANAAACVVDSDPSDFWSLSNLLFENQPAETVEGGLPDEDLIRYAQEAGADASVATCIEEGTFNNWVDDASNRAIKDPLPNSDAGALQGTPTVIIDGVKFNPSPDKTFEEALQEAIAKKTL